MEVPLPKPWLSIPGSSTALYINMVKAGEIGGALDVTLRRLADFMEKAQKIKGKVKAADVLPVRRLMRRNRPFSPCS